MVVDRSRLGSDDVGANTIDQCKKRLDKFMDREVRCGQDYRN